ncbi:MAG: hypothetical protein AAGH15_10950 [Myxococcota bacterium]
MSFPHIAYGTPRKLPKARTLPGRVVVLDVAFASRAGGVSFEKVTQPFIEQLGDRLAMWIDHHDHERHADFLGDPRFVLHTKAEHGACPELVTPERVAWAGPVDTICCHVDFDGLCSAALWFGGGAEPSPGADAAARAIDTRLGTPTERAAVLDRALRAQPRDDAMKGLMVRYLAEGAQDGQLLAQFREASRKLLAKERESQRLATRYEVEAGVAVCDARVREHSYDKTTLLLLGQELAPISVVHDETTVTAAARFDSGIDLLRLLGLEGGMPTRVSVAAKELPDVLARLRASAP